MSVNTSSAVPEAVTRRREFSSRHGLGARSWCE